MNDKIKALGEKEIKLICAEMGMSKDEVLELDDDGLIEVYDVILDIEMEEEMKSPNKMTERAVLAANILSAIGE
ncbi:MAG: hypothetical protein IJF37_02995 [Lachnospiraceae bacterium]|nr:hypothetical protein [Lachnospiraceae bacterium]